eukprot:210673-Prymnesium_polylepis.1
MTHTCTHPAARGHVPTCPDGAPCLPACLLVLGCARAPFTEAFQRGPQGGTDSVGKGVHGFTAPKLA